MPKFKKRSIEVEAVQWFPEKKIDGVNIEDHSSKGYINTLEGKLYVSPGDWVVTGVKGEKYAVKPDIFEQTYIKS